MSLLDALKDKPTPARRKIDTILSRVNKDEKLALEEALRSPEWSSAALASTLTAIVSPVSESSVRRYRREILGLRFDN